MSYETILYEKSGRIATITLNRPEKFNTIRPPMPEELEKALEEANFDNEVRAIILKGAGKAFCAGFDFSGDLEHFRDWGGQPGSEQWDPGRDIMMVTNPFKAPVAKFMSIWRSPKPVIARVHGWCVGGGSDMALLSDVIIASEDARFGTPYSRVWGAYLTGMWIYRLGLARAKLLALTGDSISGKEAAQIGLINKAVPVERLEEEVQYWAERIARCPSTQLAAMKLIVNQAFDNMGLQSTQTLGVILDGCMRNTPEGLEFVRKAKEEGVQAAIADRDGPFGDYSMGTPEKKPHGVP
ncbi:MAG: crotonase/enoyl-CoA hydratase family protein [Deltaproteobacteria bacterium]|nr:crotonase/enoyl-CoA hydratase family protein [Deltaproteobacteria bacterium]MBW1924817.1 crotonase/enoyl-CoA hydratase family protein [Deltaproteobacteria bacterium]MBW1950776.1 crotonase/enoyl-CoA hydratase family protein [Deltaproteobacteria bacterium]MBW2009090.1 crotonase/enoyl-CoA hydratase family protein [Deltaproteobacteria bacterium]MBW2103551.1 crotonase/enoyl-CoA hydratase family protein [Deltaproteobacteria bacterium]